MSNYNQKRFKDAGYKIVYEVTDRDGIAHRYGDYDDYEFYYEIVDCKDVGCNEFQPQDHLIIERRSNSEPPEEYIFFKPKKLEIFWERD